jgi:hypothetical protein
VSCRVEAATLMEEYDIDRCRVRETFSFGGDEGAERCVPVRSRW